MERKLNLLVTVLLTLALIGAFGLLYGCIIDSGRLILLAVTMLFINLIPALGIGMYIEEIYKN